MSERNLSFDQVIERRNTNSLKYDFAKRRGMPEDVLPLWVADMDFRTSSYVTDALQQLVEHGIFGYSEVQGEYFEPLQEWMRKHYGWEVSERWLVKTPGIVFALAMAVKAFTKPGDAVLIQRPVYYPFQEIIEDNGRRVVSNTLTYGEDHTYRMDRADLEQKIEQENVKLCFLCNPHNPVGRVWSKEELLTFGEICRRHGVIVVSDEIHADFVFKGRHNVFAALKEEFADFTITCTSPSKTFNLAGTQISNIFISNQTLRGQFRKQIDAAGYSQLNCMGLVACEAAYRNGEEWYQAVLQYVKDNIAFTKDFIKNRIPEVTLVEPEGTYLLWLDFNALPIKQEELEAIIVQKAKLWLDSGVIFGKSGKKFQRINVACPRTVLKTALERIESAIGDWKKSR